MKREVVQETNKEILGYQKCIKEIRKKQAQIQNKIEKQEENDVYDESLYEQLDDLDSKIAYFEKQINLCRK